LSKIKVNEIVNRNGSSITIGDANTSTVVINSGTTLTGFSSTGIDDNATSTAITIDSSENVGIGTTSPNSVEAGFNGITFNGSSGSFADFESNGNHYGRIITSSSGNFSIQNPSANDTTFTTNGSERMRIRSNGNIELGTGAESISNYTTNPGNWISNENDGGEDFRVGTLVTSADASVIHIVNKTTTGSGNMMAFRVQGSTKGTISTDGSNTSYNTSSDYRLKENVVDVVDAITRVKQLQPKRFNFIEQPNKTVDGFLAHEVSSIVPEAISGTHNEVEVWKEGEELPEGVSVGDNKLDDEGNTIPVYQGIDQSKLVPLLTASLQEAIAKIEELETRLETLENA